jgi:MFS family permease
MAMFELPDWPPWALYTFIGLASFTSCVAVVQWLKDKNQSESSEAKPCGEKAAAFRAFQREYLTVYAIIMMADWFQGTNMYTLYSSYGVNISALFLTGFLSGAVWAGPIGFWIDKYGRRLSCIVYLVLEIIINICEHFNSFWILWASRIMGGMTTCILFTGFEAWMNSEHRKRGFPEAWVADTFAKASFINGLSAIIAGILAQVCADAAGEIGPFQAAIALTALALVFVAFWPENYGGSDGGDDSETKAAAWDLIKTDRKALLLGTVNALFEGSMYSFVFMWVPTMIGALKGGSLPTGLVFASLMCCISLGGVLFSPSMLLSIPPAEHVGVGCFLVGALALLVPVFTNDVVPVLGAFLVFETCVGIFQPCGASFARR